MNEYYFEIILKAIELILVFWLLGLLVKWTLVFVFGEKGAKIIGFVGYSVNFAIKKFLLEKIFKVTVYESDPSRLVFDIEKTDRWDIIFTSLVIIPMFIGLILGSLIGTVAYLIQSNLVILSIILFVVGFIIAVNSTPTVEDIEKLKECSIKSILVWFVLASLLCTGFGFLLVPLLDTLGVIIAIVAGLIGTTIITAFIPPIRNWISGKDNQSIIRGTVDLDG